MANQQKIKQTETEIYRHEGRRWPALILLLLAALLIATAVTLAGRWLYREISGSEDDTTGSTTSTTEPESNEAKEAPSAETANPSDGANDSNGETNDSKNNETPESQTVPATGDEDLPGTGG